MPVSIVVGGQFGSEGKGKVSLFFAKKNNAAAVIRVGGPNSGHTVINDNGVALIFKQLPTSCIVKGIKSVLTAGNYINLEIIKNEIQLAGLRYTDLLIDPFAVIITDNDIRYDQESPLKNEIGSTGCGINSVILNRIQRNKAILFAKDVDFLKPYIGNTNVFLSQLLKDGKRVLIEGTQGFGLSLLHSDVFPYCTGRDTTAASFLSEAGLSPMDVDDVIMVLRAFPIRVGGNSGPLKKETTWEEITENAGATNFLREYTSVTKKIRRVAHFDEEVVKRAIAYNNPTQVILNHVDYIDANFSFNVHNEKIKTFINTIESKINRKIDFIGLDRIGLIERDQIEVEAVKHNYNICK